MAYRMNEIPHDIPQRVFDVRNGATLKVSLACFYYHEHDNDLHDHIGWPSPDHPDAICQEHVIEPAPWIPNHIRIEEGNLVPIYLIEEGYTGASVKIEDETIAAASTSTVFIDQEQENIVKMNITVNLPTFTDKPKETGFTVFATKDDGIRDAVCHGIMKVLPGSQYA